MAQVGMSALDNQSLANSLDRGFETVSLAGRLQGRETMIENELSDALPDAEPVAQTAKVEDNYSITAKLPGLT